eukprot:4939765-Karenia_brevis.AAC.1
MLVCRRPGCGGMNPTKPPLTPSPPPYFASSSAQLHSSSPTYLQTAQKNLSSLSPPNPLLPGVQNVTTPAMWKQLAKTGYKMRQEEPEEDIMD